jgi:hypothetical protein
VTTGLTQPRYGMTLAQFQAYGVAVTKILQTDQTFIVLVGLARAIANVLPPTNADGSFNTAAQETAIAQIVAAAAFLEWKKSICAGVRVVSASRCLF